MLQRLDDDHLDIRPANDDDLHVRAADNHHDDDDNGHTVLCRRMRLGMGWCQLVHH